jgi:hypothetical protein
LIGRTYDMSSGFWPKAPSSPIADGLNAATKYIATQRPESLEWGPFEGLGPGIRRIKSQDDPNLILRGSSTLTSTLLEHGLANPTRASSKRILIVFSECFGWVSSPDLHLADHNLLKSWFFSAISCIDATLELRSVYDFSEFDTGQRMPFGRKIIARLVIHF